MDKWLSHPTAIKVISVLLGLLLFVIVHNDPETSPQAATPSIDTMLIEAAAIIPTGLDEKKYILTAMEPTVARIVVEGRISLLRAASNADYVVNVDLAHIKPGIQELPLSVKLPRGIKEIELSPKKITVRIEEIVKKTFDAKVLTEGVPANGYVLGTPEIISASGGVVQVTLPMDDMDRVSLVAVTANVAESNKTVVNKKAKVVVYDVNGEEIRNAIVEPSTLHIEAKVTLPSKQVPLQIRYSGSLPDQLSLVSVKPKTDQVTVYAAKEELDAITIYDGAVLDLTKVKQSGLMKVKTTPVDTIKEVNPEEIELDIVVERTLTQTFTQIPISISGAGEDVTASFIYPASGTIDLTISGAESVLSEMSLADIAIIAKLDGLVPGTHIVPLELELPLYVQPVLTGSQPFTVTVDIENKSRSINKRGNKEEKEEVDVDGILLNPIKGNEDGSTGGSNSIAE